MPPPSETSKLTKSTAPPSSSRRTPWLVISHWPAVTGMRVACRTRAISARRRASGTALRTSAMSSGSIRRAKLDRVLHVPAPVGVDREDEVVAGGLARRRTRLESSSGVSRRP